MNQLITIMFGIVFLTTDELRSFLGFVDSRRECELVTSSNLLGLDTSVISVAVAGWQRIKKESVVYQISKDSAQLRKVAQGRSESGPPFLEHKLDPSRVE